MNIDKIESFINETLREDLRQQEEQLDLHNKEILEYIQLKNMIETFKEHFNDDHIKTQMNIGGNCFMQAKFSTKDEKILVDVGLHHYLELSYDEALKFCEFKIKLLKKHIDVIRDASIQTRANIKLGLLCVSENMKNL